MLRGRDEIKFVLADREDYEYARGVLEDMKNNPDSPVHFSPVSGMTPPHVLAQWILEDHLNVRLHLQLHKIIWGPERKGV